MSNWVFRSEVTDDKGETAFVRLVKAGDVLIRRHRKIRAEANPFDPAWTSYFADRQGLLMERGTRQLPAKLWKAQGGVCPVCQEPILEGGGWDVHHVTPKAQGGTNARTNFALLHDSCHWQAHSPSWNSELSAPVKRGFVGSSCTTLSGQTCAGLADPIGFRPDRRSALLPRPH